MSVNRAGAGGAGPLLGGSNVTEGFLVLGATRSHVVAARSRSSLAQHPRESRPSPPPRSSPTGRVSSCALNLNGKPGTRQLAALTRFCSEKTWEEQPVPAGAFIFAISIFFTRAALCGCGRFVRARAASWRLYKRPRCVLCPRLCGGTLGAPPGCSLGPRQGRGLSLSLPGRWARRGQRSPSGQAVSFFPSHGEDVASRLRSVFEPHVRSQLCAWEHMLFPRGVQPQRAPGINNCQGGNITISLCSLVWSCFKQQKLGALRTHTPNQVTEVGGSSGGTWSSRVSRRSSSWVLSHF